MNTAFDGRVALVTGAGRGIGLAVALQLAKAGAQVALFARSVDQLGETVATVRGLDGSAVVIPASLGDPDAVAKAAARVTRDVGPVDILVNNSAVVSTAGPPSASSLGRGAGPSTSTSTPPSSSASPSSPGCSSEAGVGS